VETELQKLRIHKDHKSRRGSRSVLPWILLILLLLAGGAGYYQWQIAHGATVVETIRVRPMESAQTQNDLVLLNATGYIIAAHKIELASKVIGRVAWIGVEMDDKIEKGQVLVRLEDDEYRARVIQAQGQLDNAKARLAELEAGSRPEEIAQMAAQLEQIKVEQQNAQRNFQRLSAIRTTTSVTKQELDDAESLMHAREAQVDSAKEQYELAKAGPRKEQIDAQRATVSQLEGVVSLARIDLDNTVIRAPINSTVLERNVEVGEFVTNGFVGDRGAKGYVVSLADLNDLLVELDIDQRNFGKIGPEQPCWITTDAYPDRKYDGVVERISPLANRQKATILVRVRILHPDGLLKPDMNATVAFLARPASTTGPEGPAATGPAATLVFRIPAGAIRDGAVFIVEDGKAVRRAVMKGMTTMKGEIEIREGLIGGEDLILHPPESLREGDKVTVQKS
jgi:HlyD family secretion protein